MFEKQSTFSCGPCLPQALRRTGRPCESLDRGTVMGATSLGEDTRPPAPQTVRRSWPWLTTLRQHGHQEAIDGSRVLMYHLAHPVPIPSLHSSALLKLSADTLCCHSLPDVLHMQQELIPS